MSEPEPEPEPSSNFPVPQPCIKYQVICARTNLLRCRYNVARYRYLKERNSPIFIISSKRQRLGVDWREQYFN
jgi:hypothetical protein